MLSTGTSGGGEEDTEDDEVLEGESIGGMSVAILCTEKDIEKFRG